jgi:hypothetical protein
MNNRLTQPPRPAAAAALAAAELRLARRVAAALSEQPLAHDIEQRLRVARQQAVAMAGERRRALASAAQTAGSGWLSVGGSAAAMGGPAGRGPASMWQRVAMVLPLLALLAGLYGIDQWSLRESVLAAAEVDALLLADDLPPTAYTDPGFSEFLRSPAQ